MFMNENGFSGNVNVNNGGKFMSDFADKVFAAAGVDKKQAEAEKKELKAQKKKDDRWNTKRFGQWLREEKNTEIWWNRIANTPYITTASGESVELESSLINNLGMIYADELGLSDNVVEDYFYRLGGAAQNTAFGKVRNPVREALLGEYTSITDLANNITATDKMDELLENIVRVRDDFDHKLWTTWLTNWMLVVNDNESMRRMMNGVLVLLGPQGQGKTTFCEWLCGPFYQYFQHISSVNKDNRDDKMTIYDCLLCELAEARDMFASGSIGWWKDTITSKFDNMRPFYGRRSIKTPRHCGMIVTTNDYDILFDRTGTRRFYMTALWDGFDPKALVEQYDQQWVLGLLRQILAYGWRNQEWCTYLDRKDMAEQDRRNRENTYIDKNESALYSLFEWGDEEEETEWQSQVYRASDLVAAATELAARSRIAAQRIKGWDQNQTKTGNILRQWLKDGKIKEGVTKGKGRKGYILPEWSKDITLEMKGLSDYTDSYTYNR